MSAAVAAAAAAANISRYNSLNISSDDRHSYSHHVSMIPTRTSSLYESQKLRDWNTFCQYLRDHSPPLTLPRCTAAHVIEFLHYLDQFGNTKVHSQTCPFYGHLHSQGSCPCPLQQASSSLDALVSRLKAAFEEKWVRPETNPFDARAVKMYLREVKDEQTKARGMGKSIDHRKGT